MRHFIHLVFTFSLSLFISVPSAVADSVSKEQDEQKHLIQLEDYLDYETVGNPQISPDGREVMYSRQTIDKMTDKRVSTLWLVNRDGSKNRQLMEGGGGLWSPDGSRIAFVKADKNGTPQIFIRFMDAEGLVTQVTRFEHRPRSMSWSPDGKQLAFVARVPPKKKWSVKLPGRPKGAKWTEDPVIIDNLHYRQDRVGYTNTGFDHLFIVPAEGGTPRQLTSGDWNVGNRILGVIATAPRISWSPDGENILFDGPGKEIENPHWFESHVNKINIATGKTEPLTRGRGVFGDPVFSPDGRKIAFSGYPEHNTSYPVPNLYIMDADGQNQEQLTKDMSDGPVSLNWSSNSREIYFTIDDQGDRNLRAINMSGQIRNITNGQQVVSLGSVSITDEVALTISNPSLPPAIALVSGRTRSYGDKPTLLTDVNSDILFGKTLADVEEIWYEATADTGEKARVQGWVVKPPNFDPDKKYPLLLSIHGGPHAMYNTGFNFTFQEFAARGYVVLYTNPRGSTGYGDEFANAIRHRYPGPVDYADLMAGVDLVIEKGYVDPDRMFVTGCSGGGVLTTWVIANTDRFKAAAALCPVTNWIGMSGTTDVVGWLYEFFPKPFWEDPKPWLDHSTIMHVGKVSTPTLLMTGTEDLRTPIGEAEEYFAALKIRNVPTKLVPMNGESHGTRSIPSNYLRTSLIMRKWFDEFDPTKSDEDNE